MARRAARRVEPLKDLQSSDPLVRRAAAEALGRMGERAARPEVVRTLAERLRDEEPDVRRAAAEALGRIREAAPREVVGGVLRTGDDDPLAPEIVAWVLGR